MVIYSDPGLEARKRSSRYGQFPNQCGHRRGFHYPRLQCNPNLIFTHDSVSPPTKLISYNENPYRISAHVIRSRSQPSISCIRRFGSLDLDLARVTAASTPSSSLPIPASCFPSSILVHYWSPPLTYCEKHIERAG